MSRLTIVDDEYRLRPADLESRSHTVTITAVSMQGLEEMQPVAHFAETRKRLVLDRDQCTSLILLTGSTLTQDWVGCTVVLTPAIEGAEPIIRLLPPLRQSSLHWSSPRWSSLRWSSGLLSLRHLSPRRWLPAHTLQLPRPNLHIPGWVGAICVVALLSVVSFFYARTYGSEIMATVQSLFGG
jgi:hypothetical protein